MTRRTYIYDKATGKMVERPKPNVVPLLTGSQTTLAVDLDERTGFALIQADRELSRAEQKSELERTFDRAEAAAERGMERADCVQIQEQIQHFRNRLGEI